ncbi:MAG: RsmB/NOP family class I SAM-dependent RNA methyltransferase [Sphingobium sp.]|uniref:RsmB/NOP family class I SAM-dependent RNA methyltransferase n=1 Tax=Sphingobium sp. TaxID=1912891 RepID=UPI0029A9FD53|nr:RsmB/NOP family class I SAM-dependent RNA methyltransferase [Sphingobium sp.]MDX3909681.1 RsmB/NOP family class I SAM-dependent RNA methyltransferase [Sphingobium sp.]
MTPAARVQAAIDLLDEVVLSARDGGPAADTLIARYFKTRRYAGSKDRRAVRDLVYDAIRRAGERPESGRAAMLGLVKDQPDLAASFDGSPHGPAAIGEGEPATPARAVPRWILPLLSDLIDARERTALLARAPLDARVNRLKAVLDTSGPEPILIPKGDHDSLPPFALSLSKGQAEPAEAPLPSTEAPSLRSGEGFDKLSPNGVGGSPNGKGEITPIPNLPDALRLPEGYPLEKTQAWEQGLLEVQDAGSQIIAAACAARPGMTVIDLCAGAGGKTLALAAAMEGQGTLIAADTVRSRLQRLTPRAERAGAGFIQTILLDQGREATTLGTYEGKADIVLVDAPCSGTGTWRRNPEARWRLTPDRLTRLVAEQARIVDIAAPLVKDGGRLVYAVCALTDREGRDQIDAFLMRHPGWKAAPVDTPAGRNWGQGRLLTPHHDGTDGFFLAVLEKG